MGCSESKEAAPAPAAAGTVPSKAAAPSNPVMTMAAKAPAHETTSSATYSAAGQTGYVGLLANKKDEKIEYDERASKINTAVHPLDDRCSSKGTSMLTFSGTAMTVRYFVAVEAPEADQKKIQVLIDEKFDMVDKTFNNWNSESEISQISQLKGMKSKDVTPQLLDLFTLCNRVNEETEGRFDPTSGTVLWFWKKHIVQNGRPPVEDECSHLKFAVGWTEKLKVKGTKVTKQNTNTLIDLCGIAKGHAIDLIVDSLHVLGYKNIYVDWGGDISAKGKHPSGRPWRTVLIKPPHARKLFEAWSRDALETAVDENDAVYSLEFDNCAIATSGDYAQLHKFGYHHIVDINKKSLLKVGEQPVSSVSVLATQCALADAYATATMTYPTTSEAVNFLTNLMNSSPDVLGFCVMSRSSTDFVATEQFVQIRQEVDDLSAPEFEDTLPGERATIAGFEKMLKLVPRQSVVAYIEHEELDEPYIFLVDSLAMCSRDPLRLSFHISGKSLAYMLVNQPGSKFTLLFLSENEYELSERAAFADGYALDKKEAKQLFEEAPTIECETFACTVQESAGKRVAKGSPDSIQFMIAEPLKAKLSPLQKPRLTLFGAGYKCMAPIPRQDAVVDITDRVQAILRDAPVPMCVITVESGGVMWAMTASSVRVTSHSPQFLSFNVQRSSVFKEALKTDGVFYCAINYLPPSEKAIAERYSSNVQFKKGELPLEERNIDHEYNEEAPPVLSLGTSLICKSKMVLPVGDHILVVVEVLRARWPTPVQNGVLVRFGRNYIPFVADAAEFSAEA